MYLFVIIIYREPAKGFSDCSENVFNKNFLNSNYPCLTDVPEKVSAVVDVDFNSFQQILWDKVLLLNEKVGGSDHLLSVSTTVKL